MSDVTAETFAYYLSESENGWCKIPRRVADDMAKAHEAQSAELSRLRAEVISEPAECYGGCEDPQCPYMHHPLTMRQDRDNLRAELSRLSALVAWQDIETAPKDGTRILVLLKNPLPSDRDDLRIWDGIPFVARHPGLADDGFDFGWNFAAPVGHGGFPDEWFQGWMNIPAPPISQLKDTTNADK